MPEKPPVNALHTLKDDLQNVVREEKISLVRAVSLEQDRNAREKKDFAPIAPPHQKKTGMIFAAFLMLTLGGAALFGVYAVMQTRNTNEPAPAGNSILFAESSAQFALDNQAPDDLKRKLAGARTGLQGALGSITAVIPTKSVQAEDGTMQLRAASLGEFLSAIGASPPDQFLRAVDGRFFFGFHVVDTNAPIFVIPVTSYDRAFAGMLAWEGSLNADLSPIFQPLSATVLDQNGLPALRTFTDDVMRNYDVRELKDDQGKVRLYYSFPSKNVLVIAESPYSFAEILSRLQASRQL